MEEKPAEASASVDSSASPSVAQLAGRFREQAAAAQETPASKPTRRRPPCSLPLLPPRVELGQNGEEKSSPSASHVPKIKVKSSPLIEKLQANLSFDPAALLPGASPKSPGLKATSPPLHSPPSTPSSPGVQSGAGEPEEVPVSFDQPPEGTQLPCYNKVRTRGSIKRRPPSRRFRRSQSDCGDLGEVRATESSQENGAREENGDDVFPPGSRGTEGRPGPMSGAALRRASSSSEEPHARAPDEASPDPTSSAGELELPEDGHSSPAGDTGTGQGAAGQETAGNREDGPRHGAQDAEKPPGEAAAGEAMPHRPPGGEASVSEQDGAGPGTHDTAAAPEGDLAIQDSKM